MNRLSKSGYRGVTWNKRVKRWQVIIQQFGKQYFLGYFDDPQEASVVYQQRLRDYQELKAALDDVAQHLPTPSRKDEQ